jgi:hypothetical protein
VLQTGNPTSMPWRDKVKAIVQAWYPGQAGGQAIAEVLTGAVNPSGRLPITFLESLDQTPRPQLPGLGTPWGTPTTIPYDEGAEIGYRWYAKTAAKPMFAFGHGLVLHDVRIRRPRRRRRRHDHCELHRHQHRRPRRRRRPAALPHRRGGRPAYSAARFRKGRARAGRVA